MQSQTVYGSFHETGQDPSGGPGSEDRENSSSIG